jgi:hypothetical protein
MSTAWDLVLITAWSWSVPRGPRSPLMLLFSSSRRALLRVSRARLSPPWGRWGRQTLGNTPPPARLGCMDPSKGHASRRSQKSSPAGSGDSGDCWRASSAAGPALVHAAVKVQGMRPPNGTHHHMPSLPDDANGQDDAGERAHLPELLARCRPERTDIQTTPAARCGFPPRLAAEESESGRRDNGLGAAASAESFSCACSALSYSQAEPGVAEQLLPCSACSICCGLDDLTVWF